MLRGIAVVWMPVQDIERAKGFYRDTLGLPITKEDGDWAEVDANGLTLGLNGREPSGAQGEGGPVVTFQPAAGLEETLNDLQSQGVEVPAGISEHPCGRVATLVKYLLRLLRSSGRSRTPWLQLENVLYILHLDKGRAIRSSPSR